MAREWTQEEIDEDIVWVFGDWVECWNCGGEGVSDHDCGEDCCVCLWPEDNVRCDICRGKGGWTRPEKGKLSSEGDSNG